MTRFVVRTQWHRYHDGKDFLSLSDLRLSFEQAYLAGADVNVMWGEEVEWEPVDWPPHGEAAMKAWFNSTFAPLVNNWIPPTRVPLKMHGRDDDATS